MKKVKCISIRETSPKQITVGNVYYLDETTLYVDSDGNEYAMIYRDIHKKQVVGRLSTQHFAEPELCDIISGTDDPKKVFLIKYKVDTGYEYFRDEAIVVAKDNEFAVFELKSAIRRLGNDYWVDEVVSVEEFNGPVFTKHYGIHPRFINTKKEVKKYED